MKARDVGWSILDVAMSPDGRHLIYATWSDYSMAFIPLFPLAHH